jgi:hypothetical protein
MIPATLTGSPAVLGLLPNDGALAIMCPLTDAAGSSALCVHVPAVVPGVTGPAVAHWGDRSRFRALLGPLILLSRGGLQWPAGLLCLSVLFPPFCQYPMPPRGP